MPERADPRQEARRIMGDQADGLRRLFGASPAMLAVAARETDVIEAYARIKRAVHEHGCRCFRITITHARTPEEAQTVFDNLRRVAHEYLGVRLEYLGMAVAGDDGAAAVGRARRPGVVAHDSVL